VVAVAYHQPKPIRVDLAGMGIDVGGNLGVQRCQISASAPAGTGTGGIGGRVG
jgi:hypothetical protein